MDKEVTIKCEHGKGIHHLLARIDTKIERVPIMVEAVVSETLPVAVNIQQLTPLCGRESLAYNKEDTKVTLARNKV